MTELRESESFAIFGERIASEFVEHSKDPVCLEREGFWAVTQTFEGDFDAYRFGRVDAFSSRPDFPAPTFESVPLESWTSSLGAASYMQGVDHVRDDIARGWVYQTNLCRVLSSPLEASFNAYGLWTLMRDHNPAPYLSMLSLDAGDLLDEDVRVVSVSPELFLRRNGNHLLTSPIKGTAHKESELLEKDSAENVMIVDLMRNDLSAICIEGSVRVVDLLRVEQHPTLVHLVSDVEGELHTGTSWSDVFAALTPPGSVSGAPKSSSLEVISRLEPTPRGLYCGFVGWVDTRGDAADGLAAELAVAIRTFWQTHGDTGPELRFGSGAGITWGSDPRSEWDETELKARNLLNVAAMRLA